MRGLRNTRGTEGKNEKNNLRAGRILERNHEESRRYRQTMRRALSGPFLDKKTKTKKR